MNANTDAAARKDYSLNFDSVASALKQADDSKWANLDMLPVVDVDYVLTLKKDELVASLETMDIYEALIKTAKKREREELLGLYYHYQHQEGGAE